MRFEDKVAVVTGAAQGIGQAIAETLARQGAHVVVADLQAERAEATAKEITANTGCQAIAVQVDVADNASAKAMIDRTIAEFGRIDILVNNAGTTRDNLIMRMKEADWDLVLNVNLKGAFNCSKAAVRHMIRKRSGRSINITSIAGQMGNPGQTNYSASKAGQIGFTKALAREVGSRNITVNAIAAGYVETDIWEGVPEEARQAILSMVPLGRKGEAQEIADAAAFLASDQASYITGQILGIDGGMAMM